MTVTLLGASGLTDMTGSDVGISDSLRNVGRNCSTSWASWPGQDGRLSKLDILVLDFSGFWTGLQSLDVLSKRC